MRCHLIEVSHWCLFFLAVMSDISAALWCTPPICTWEKGRTKQSFGEPCTMQSVQRWLSDQLVFLCVRLHCDIIHYRPTLIVLLSCLPIVIAAANVDCTALNCSFKGNLPSIIVWQSWKGMSYQFCFNSMNTNFDRIFVLIIQWYIFSRQMKLEP